MRRAGPLLGLLLLLAGAAHALYLDQSITAFQVTNGKITVDGRPEATWREIAARGGVSQIAFNDYGKIVLLEPVEVRNASPEDHYQAPAQGSVSLLAAYDDAFLYFFFLVRENSAFNPVSACSVQEMWKANAADVFVDPSPWSETLYQAYFSADAAQVSYGTSSKTIQVARPAWPGEMRKYYRDRTVANRFDLRTPSTQVQFASATRTAADPLTYGIEMRIPATAPDYGPGKAIFISWGYNHYPVGGGGGCDSLPIAYRWAKHVKSYSGQGPKPPGWVEGDNVHFDPLRSYDGWGRFELVNSTPRVDGTGCRSATDTDWDLVSWRSACSSNPTTALLGPPHRARTAATMLNGSGWPAEPHKRDIRGRLSPGRGAQLYILPILR